MVDQTAAREAPAAGRNREPLLAILRQVLPVDGTVLEIGSGTGQHAAWFAPELSPRRWLPTDPAESALASIAAWSALGEEPRPLSPRALDASLDNWPVGKRDQITAVFSANVVHISPWAVTEGLVSGAGRVLQTGGKMIFYGPFKRNGKHTAEGNVRFDKWLQDQDSRWGVRSLERISELALEQGFLMPELHDMPANNFCVSFAKS
ncbi:MAG: DUF938 domain-containing protein [Rhodospirillaceae bacterium]|jgi:SAM-dependent methyltransferase|nr:DUF938 domain-containing protein [Rhodospirillaceae bacterium]MBT6139836.1 DUF938 domain-containing protein [Rhodospirillaceae bacterium]